MADNNNYSSKPFLYQSRGLGARWEMDRVPEGYYLNLLNGFEREEGSMSSRYGTQIINRSPYGSSPGYNYFFPSPVTSLARLLYQSSASRFAGLANGTLWQGPGYSQGAYSQIYSGLSGQPFQTVVASCYETSQAFMFIYDAATSIKIAAGSNPATPQLTGIDPPPYTANSLPYSPLLTLIDSCSALNTYSIANVSGWGYSNLESLIATSAQLVTDFPEFFGVAQSGIGTGYTPSSPTTSVTAAASSSVPVNATSSPVTGFASTPLVSGQSTTVTVNLSGSVAVSGGGIGYGIGCLTVQYSVNGGASWNTFNSWSQEVPWNTTATLPAQNVNFSIPAGVLNNLNQLQIQIVATSTSYGGPTTTTFGQVNSTSATVYSSGQFGVLAPGMLAILSASNTASIPISSVSSAGLSAGSYRALSVQTQTPHGLSASNYISLYGTSNDLVDGFYPVQQVIASNTFLVPYGAAPGGSPVIGSPTYINATGGFVHGGAASPPCCVLTNQYASPYPSQISAWGFYQQVPLTTTTFPVGAWAGTVATNVTATIGKSASLDLSIGNQVTDSDLIVLTLAVGSPANIANIRLQFDVNSSNYTSSYYYANIAPAYYQGNIANQLSAYATTQNQILADALGLLTGQPTSSTTAQLQPSTLSTGAGSWIAVLIPRGNFLPVGNAGQAGLDWSNVTGWQLVVQTAATAITGDGSSTVAINGLYLQWGYGLSSFAGVGYDWRYTYYNSATGTESSPSGEQFFSEQYGYLASLAAPFYLRQAAYVSGQFSTDPQVTHVRAYRRGGIYASNWFLTQQFANLATGGQFFCKDVTPDAALAEAQPLALDNDPPVTSSLVAPIQTTLATATTGPSQTPYSVFVPQTVTVTNAATSFVTNQTVLVGNSYNLEEVLVIAGGTGQFTAVLRLQHNAGEQVSATSVPRQACSLCALSNQGGVTQVWLAGDLNNPHYLYYSKPGYPENFSPAGYVAVSSPDDPIMAVVNWRGTIVVGTTKTWYIIVGGAKPYAQPTGAAHGMASSSWTLVEGEIRFTSQDGLRAFSGADGQYMTLPVEWMFRASPATLVPKLNASDYSSTILCQFNNQVYASFISASNSLSTGNGLRYRLRFDDQARRFGLDDVPATAMLWEQDTNAFLLGKQISATGYAIVQDWVGDYDDGGWNAGGTALIQTPISLITQTPYHDLGKPHFPKQWNMLEGDYNTEGQPIQTTLLFNTEPPTSLALPAASTGTVRAKVQYQIPAAASASNPLASGVQAYAMSIQHQMSVTVAPTLYQEDVYAVVLADLRTSWDTYWQGTEGDLLGIQPKNIYCDYTSTAQLIVSIYADGNDAAPYYIDNFTLIPQANRSVVRVQLPARKGRLWRVIITSTSPFQIWAPVRVSVKPLQEGSGFEERSFPVYQ
jgi:hypothetical protein